MRISGRWVLLLAVAFALATVGSIATAQYVNRGQMPPSMAKAPDADRPMHQPMHQMSQMNQMHQMATMNRLGLTEEQRASIAKIREDAEAARTPMAQQMMQLRTEMRAELLKDQPDMATVHRLAQQMGDLRTQMQVQTLDQRMAIRNVLTPEQREKVMMNRSSQRMNGRREMMGMRRGMMMRRGAMRGEMMRGCPPGCCMKQGEMGGMRGWGMMQKGQEGAMPGCRGMMQKGQEGGAMPGCRGMMQKGQEGCAPGCGMMKKGDKDEPRGCKMHSEMMAPDDPDRDDMAAPAMMGAGYDSDEDEYADIDDAFMPDYDDADPMMVWPEVPEAGQPNGQGQ
jgi:Spy/CpxP family protein refolding chaperone